jgi:hypothetical protein
MKGVVMICPRCKGSQLRKDSRSYWSVLDQQWRNDSHDIFFCETCCQDIDSPEVRPAGEWTIADSKL